ncbi:MAG: hypothetical protein WC959_11045 [Kiritimatiellales bacterium]
MSDKMALPENAPRPDEDVLLDLNFVPQWAKKEPGINHYGISDRTERERSDRRPRERSGGRSERRRDRDDRRGSRPPRRERERNDDRSEPRRGLPDRREHRPERVELPVDIKFLPDQKMLGSMVRQIHHSKRAYPLVDLAGLFLADTKGHLVKIEVRSGSDYKFYQGRKSKIVATGRETLLNQIISDHLDTFFIKEELDVEPPAGVFPMIAKIDDMLIGPPNHHSYADRLAEIHRTRYAGMPFERFKEKVQTVREEELIERWKQEASKKTVYRLKDAPAENAREFSLIQAEEYLRTAAAGDEIEEVTRAVIPSALARKIKDYNLIRMIREAWQAESRFPISLSFALRAAFRHLHLYMFKAGRNMNFVTAVKPDPIAPDATVENIRVVLEFLADHPGSTREQLVEELCPGAEKDSPAALEILNPIRWLVERGHLIEFFNGTLSVPSRRRRRQ